MRASLAVGLNCPVSIKLIVFRDTPTISASWFCDIFRSVRASLRRYYSAVKFSCQVPIDDLHILDCAAAGGGALPCGMATAREKSFRRSLAGIWQTAAEIR